MNNQTKKIDFVAFSDLRPATSYVDTKDILLSHWRELRARDEGIISLYKYGCGLSIDVDGIIGKVSFFNGFPEKRRIEGMHLGMAITEVHSIHTKLIENDYSEKYWREFTQDLDSDNCMTLLFSNDKLVAIDIENANAEYPKKENFDFNKYYPKPSHDGDSTFSDNNFKLVVLSELMERGIIDLGSTEELASFVLGRYIDFNEDEKFTGYESIPECLEYLTQYPLNAELLSQIEELTFDGGLEIYRYINDQWDGESGEFDITSLIDAQKLPNLKTLSINSMMEPSEEIADYIEVLKANGIDVIQ